MPPPSLTHLQHAPPYTQLVLAMDAGDDAGVAAALRRVGVVTEREEPALQAKLAYGMFDTRGK